MTIKRIEASIIETQKSIQENVKAETTSFQNPILKRCSEKPIDRMSIAREAYDRMHHRHSRS